VKDCHEKAQKAQKGFVGKATDKAATIPFVRSVPSRGDQDGCAIQANRGTGG
jgi:hypothetical protein